MDDDVADDSKFGEEVEDDDESLEEAEEQDDMKDAGWSTRSLVGVEDHRDTLRRLSEPKRTPPILFKYEMTQALGVRTKQLQLGAMANVSTAGCRDEIQIAERELEEKKMPLIVVRHVSPTEVEYWRIGDLQLYK
jgi:DNA-directed RNA polymerase I, II, and III subunit RPABC2